MSTELTTTRADDSAGGDIATVLGMSTGENWRACELLASSELVPKAYQNKPANIAVAASMGKRLGLDLFSALASIAVINGTPAIWGDGRLAVCQNHPEWRGMSVDWASDGSAVVVTVRRAEGGDVGSYAGRFSKADAQAAGLLGKAGPWSSYPSRMVELRARSYALRAAFADALMGFAAREDREPETTRPARVYELKPSVTIVTPAATVAQVSAPPAEGEQAAAPKTPREVFAAAVSGARSRGVDGAVIKSSLSDLLERAVTTMNDVADAELDRATACVDSLTGDA